MKLILLLCLTGVLFAQNETITLRDWRSKTGDDAAWARADFNDSDWTPGGRPARQTTRLRTAKVAWFRTAVTIPAMWAGQKLALALGPTKDAYEVFVNGELVGRFGSMPPPSASSAADDADVAVYPERVRSFVLPRTALAGETLQIAARVWSLRALNNGAANIRPRASEGTEDPVIGLAETVMAKEELETARNWLARLPTYFLWLLVLACGVFCLWLYRTDRSELELLWAGLALLANGAAQFNGVALIAGWMPFNTWPATVLAIGLFLGVHFFYCLLLGELLPEVRRVIRWAALPIALASLATFIYSYWPLPLAYSSAEWISRAGTLTQTALGLVAAGVGLWTKRFDRCALGVGVAARSYTIFIGTVGARGMQIGETIVQKAVVGNSVVALSMAAILYYRFERRNAERQEAERDLEAARRVQEALLDAGGAAYPGFALEVAYHPAQQVGGDFHFFSQSEQDGSLLIVVGDVSGKGLQAAMVVASVIGSLRNEDSRAPGEVLARLSRSLVGRTGGGFVTCCCALLTRSGQLTVANAGHLPPYCDGREIAIESGLPLGVVPGIIYSESVVEAGRVTFLSDGVVEAADAKGGLFGFDRAREISGKAAGAIAAAAKAWGQNDDITVVTVRRTA